MEAPDGRIFKTYFQKFGRSREGMRLELPAGVDVEEDDLVVSTSFVHYPNTHSGFHFVFHDPNITPMQPLYMLGYFPSNPSLSAL